MLYFSINLNILGDQPGPHLSVTWQYDGAREEVGYNATQYFPKKWNIPYLPWILSNLVYQADLFDPRRQKTAV